MRSPLAYPLRAGLAAGILLGGLALWLLRSPGRPESLPPTPSLGSGRAQDVLPGLYAPLTSDALPPSSDAAEASLSLLVQTSDGAPIVGALAYAVAGGGVSHSPEGVASTTSGEGGLATLPIWPPAGSVVLVTHPGYVASRVPATDFDASKGGTLERPFTVVLDKGLSVAGVVLDETGQPVPGVVVNCLAEFGMDILMERGTTLPGERAAGALRSATTDDRGRFGLSGIRELPVDLFAQHKDYVHRVGIHPAQVTAADEEMEIRVSRLVKIDLVALDANSGHPVSALMWSFTGNPAHATMAAGRVPSVAGEDISGPGADGRYRQFFFIHQTVASKADAPSVRVEAPGYRSIEASLHEALVRPMDGGPRTVELKLLPATAPYDFGELRLEVEIEGAALQPDTMQVTLASQTDEDRPQLAWSLAAPVLAIGGAPAATLRLPAGRYVVKASVNMGVWLPDEDLGLVEVSAAGTTTIRMRPRVRRARVHVTADGTSLRDFQANFYLLSDGDDVTPSGPGRVARPLLLLRSMEWTELPDYAPARRLSAQPGPYLGDLFLPPGRYGVQVFRDGYKPTWAALNLSDDPASGSGPSVVRIELSQP